MSQLWDTSGIAPQKNVVMAGETIPAIFWNAVAARGPNVWMRQKDLGIWRSWTWNETGQAVREIGHGLMALGFEARHTASILSNTNIKWVLCDLAVLSAGGISNGIYPTDAPEQVNYLCEDSSTRVLFVEDDEQLDKALAVRDTLPLLQKIVVFDMEGLRDFHDPMVISLKQLQALGRAHAQQHPDMLTQRSVACKPEELAILVYTSGTTGKPKGGMHSHHGLVFTVRGFNTLIPRDERDECMCFLPLCHIAERMGGEYFSMYTGAKLNFVENPETVPENVREIAPTVFGAVPRVWEKFYSGVMIALKEAGGLQQAVYGWAIGVGHQVVDLVLAQKPVPLSLKLRFHVARLLALNNVRKMIGIHRARFLVTGAAPISPDLVRWYLALGLPMLEVWGMTETCGAGTGAPAHRSPDRDLDGVGRAHFTRVDDADLGHIQRAGHAAHDGRNHPDGELVAQRVVTGKHDAAFRIANGLQHAAELALHQPPGKQKEPEQRETSEHKQRHAHVGRGNRQVQNAFEVSKSVVAAKAGFIAEKQQHGGKSQSLRDDGKVNALDARAKGEVTKHKSHQRRHQNDEEQGGDKAV